MPTSIPIPIPTPTPLFWALSPEPWALLLMRFASLTVILRASPQLFWALGPEPWALALLSPVQSSHPKRQLPRRHHTLTDQLASEEAESLEHDVRG